MLITYVDRHHNDYSISVTVLQCSTLLQNSRGLAYSMWPAVRLYFLQAEYLSVTFSQLITFQIAFR